MVIIDILTSQFSREAETELAWNWMFHASYVSASAVRDVKKGTEYRDLQYNPILVGR